MLTTKNINNNLPYIPATGDIFEKAEQRIRTEKGSSILGCNVIIPHVCNNVNGFGAGFANDVAKRYPIVKQNFHMLGKDATLGYVQFITVKEDPVYRTKLIFANMVAQNGVIGKNNQRPLKYPALVMCMSKVRKFSEDLVKNEDSAKVEIFAPKFGSGLAGGDWKFITDLIEDMWANQKVLVFTK